MSCIVAGEYAPPDVFVAALPLYHCAQMHCFMMPALSLGATTVLLGSPDPAAMTAAIIDHGATSVFAPPTVWISLLAHPGFDAEHVGTLRKGYYGAAIMPVHVIRELTARLPEVRLWNFYGQTELGPLVSCLPPSEQLQRAGSAGRPVLYVQTRVVDDELRDVGPGEVGEVVHRSPQVMLGYYRDPERTATAMQGGWFHSGDLATRDEDGYITIVDRKKDMINTGGENVSSREVEEVIFEHPAVAEVAVIAVADDRWIEAVCAVVVRRPGETVSDVQLREFVRARLAGLQDPQARRVRRRAAEEPEREDPQARAARDPRLSRGPRAPTRASRPGPHRRGPAPASGAVGLTRVDEGADVQMRHRPVGAARDHQWLAGVVAASRPIQASGAGGIKARFASRSGRGPQLQLRAVGDEHVGRRTPVVDAKGVEDSVGHRRRRPLRRLARLLAGEDLKQIAAHVAAHPARGVGEHDRAVARALVDEQPGEESGHRAAVAEVPCASPWLNACSPSP